MFHLVAPLLVFDEVGRQGLAEGWDPVVWTSDGNGIRTAEGPRIEDVAGPKAVEEADLLVLPSWPSDLPPADAALIDRLRAAHDRGSSVARLCLGAFPLVDSGLADGRDVETHWGMVDQLRGRRSGLSVKRGRALPRPRGRPDFCWHGLVHLRLLACRALASWFRRCGHRDAPTRCGSAP